MSIADILDSSYSTWVRLRDLESIVRSSRELPAGDWQLEGVSLEGCGEVNERIAQLLPYAAHITELSLSGTAANDMDLFQLQKFPGLQRLDLSFCDDFTDAGIASLTNLVHLTDLRLRCCDGITDAGIGHVTSLSSLRKLDIDGCKQLTRNSLQFVATLVDLTSLTVDRISCGDDGLRILRPIRGLQELSIENCGITADGLENLNHFMKLRKLSIAGVSGDGDHGWNLFRLKDLAHLKISDCGATDDCLLFLGQLVNLRELHIDYCDQLGGDFFAYMRPLSQLTELKVLNCGAIDGDSYFHLGKCTAIRELSVNDSDESMNGISDHGFSAVRHMAQLEDLHLVDCNNLTNDALHALAECRHLRKLFMFNCLGVTDEGVAPLRHLTELEELTLAASGWATHEKDGFTRLRCFTDECLKYICDLPLLRSLCLESADLRGVHTSLFQKMTSLRELDLKRVTLDDRAAASIGTLTKLECLDLEHAEISDAGVLELKSLTSLRFLYFPDCGISPDVRALLAKSLPDCNIRD